MLFSQPRVHVNSVHNQPQVHVNAIHSQPQVHVNAVHSYSQVYIDYLNIIILLFTGNMLVPHKGHVRTAFGPS